MDWWSYLTLIFGGLILLLFLGIPVAYAFLFINLVGVIFLWGGSLGIEQLVLNIFDSVSSFTLLPIPMFIFMGEIMFRTELGTNAFNALGKWMGKIPGRLSLITVGSGTLFSILAGSSAASTTLLGSLLLPEMEKKGYKYPMTVGPILGSAGLAILIPPTILGVMLASIAGIPVGQFLVAIVMPGIILAIIFILYILIRSYLQPNLAPVYEVRKVPLKEKVVDTLKYILPLGFIVFLVLGVIILGIATPTQSAILGAVGTVILAGLYRKLSWKVLIDSLNDTVKVTVLILLIMAGSATFSQILSFTGGTQGLMSFVSEIGLSPIAFIITSQVLLLILGCFMEPLSIMMMTLPILMPLVQYYEFDPLWFGAIILLNMQMATSTPPFGMDLFAMKGVAPHIEVKQIYLAAIPFLLLNVLLIIIMIVFPKIVTWLPSLMV